ncbi:EF-hand domain-containing protein [Candidatus Marithrix sp. Canyon 246]|uniref:EF-hand domain-containing protein n=1 Tax=Candidatus Marithrix sp. Canyon 246 TaxID=1827136 RepID=UPI000849EFB2|nr:EF-hand domain-containing protein [Candidatus Marithrix sp. Canyon 246]
MKTIMLSSAVVLSLTMGTAIAEPNMANRLLEQFDVNQDGSISGEEVQSVLDQKFTTADTNTDGLLTQEEITVAHELEHQERAAKRFAELDTDGSGSLSLDEFQAGKPPADKHGGRSEGMFSRLDLDGDGMLSSLEKNAPLVDKFTRMDTNQDGVISTEELNQKPAGHRGGKERNNHVVQ